MKSDRTTKTEEKIQLIKWKPIAQEVRNQRCLTIRYLPKSLHNTPIPSHDPPLVPAPAPRSFPPLHDLAINTLLLRRIIALPTAILELDSIRDGAQVFVVEAGVLVRVVGF